MLLNIFKHRVLCLPALRLILESKSSDRSCSTSGILDVCEIRVFWYGGCHLLFLIRNSQLSVLPFTEIKTRVKDVLQCGTHIFQVGCLR
jgi:hypothetical protein